MAVIIAIDPGSEKCGVAVVEGRTVLYRAILTPERLLESVPDLAARYSPDTIAIGNGTRGREFADRLRERTDSPIEFVDETNSTLKARTRFFQENPPRGLLRLVPRGLLTPNKPIDDLAAVILAETYMAKGDGF